MSDTKIKTLTPEQLSRTGIYTEKYLKVGLNCEPLDQRAATDIINRLYTKAGYKVPPIHFVESPSAAVELYQKLDNTKEIPSFIWGQHDAGSIGFFEFFEKETDVEFDMEELNLLRDTVCTISWACLFDEVAILVNRPKEIHLDEQHRLHNENGPALAYRDGNDSIYSIHGITVPELVIMTPELLTTNMIEDEKNAEVRRVMLNRYGFAKFIIDSKNEEVHRDDYGILYKKVLDGEPEPLMCVKVVNSTPEPDGSYKDYIIQVDPNAYGGLKTAMAAVASTWREEDGSFVFKTPEDYDANLVGES